MSHSVLSAQQCWKQDHKYCKRPRLRLRPKLQDEDQEQKYKTKAEAGLRLVLLVSLFRHKWQQTLN